MANLTKSRKTLPTLQIDLAASLSRYSGIDDENYAPINQNNQNKPAKSIGRAAGSHDYDLGAPRLGAGGNTAGAAQGGAYDVDDWNEGAVATVGAASGYDLNFGAGATTAQPQGAYDVDGWDATAATVGGATGYDLNFGADFAGAPQQGQGAYDVDGWDEDKGGAAASGAYDLNCVVKRNGGAGTSTYDLGAQTTADGAYDLGGWVGKVNTTDAGGEEHDMCAASSNILPNGR